MRIRWIVTGILLLTPLQSFALYLPMSLKGLVGSADLIVVGTITKVKPETFVLGVEQVLAGDPRGKEIEISQFKNWTCASRWKDYEVGQRLLLLLEVNETTTEPENKATPPQVSSTQLAARLVYEKQWIQVGIDSSTSKPVFKSMWLPRGIKPLAVDLLPSPAGKWAILGLGNDGEIPISGPDAFVKYLTISRCGNHELKQLSVYGAPTYAEKFSLDSLVTAIRDARKCFRFERNPATGSLEFKRLCSEAEWDAFRKKSDLHRCITDS